MKWPKELWFIRHGESRYNKLRQKKAEDPEYADFVKAYEADFRSDEAIRLALIMKDRYCLDCGDWNTPLTYDGLEQGEALGRALPGKVTLPDVILRSPHDRVKGTLEQTMIGWPELRSVKVVEDTRLHEQDHGLAIIYNDWRIFHILHPEQKELYEKQGPYWYRYPQGENVPDVIERERSLIGTVIRDYGEKYVAIYSHHLTILCVRAAVERWDQHEFLRVDREERPINCGFTLYRGNPSIGQDGKLELVEYNTKLY